MSEEVKNNRIIKEEIIKKVENKKDKKDKKKDKKHDKHEKDKKDKLEEIEKVKHNKKQKKDKKEKKKKSKDKKKEKKENKIENKENKIGNKENESSNKKIQSENKMVINKNENINPKKDASKNTIPNKGFNPSSMEDIFKYIKQKIDSSKETGTTTNNEKEHNTVLNNSTKSGSKIKINHKDEKDKKKEKKKDKKKEMEKEKKVIIQQNKETSNININNINVNKDNSSTNEKNVINEPNKETNNINKNNENINKENSNITKDNSNINKVNNKKIEKKHTEENQETKKITEQSTNKKSRKRKNTNENDTELPKSKRKNDISNISKDNNINKDNGNIEKENHDINKGNTDINKDNNNKNKNNNIINKENDNKEKDNTRVNKENDNKKNDNNNINKDKKINNKVDNKEIDEKNIEEKQIIKMVNELSSNKKSRKRNNTNDDELPKSKKRIDICYKFNNEAAHQLKKEYENAPPELTEKWRKSSNLKDSGLSDIMKKGPFSNEEKEALKKAVYDYLEMNNIDKSLVLNLIFKRQYKDNNEIDMKKHQGFWKYVSQTLPNRSTESSYRCVTRMFHPDNFNGKFTEKDDEAILKLYAVYGPSWKKIGEMIGRMGTAVKDRYNSLQKKIFTGSGAWTKEEEEKFVEIVQEMKNNNKFVNDMPLFTEISKQLKTRSPKQCYDHWSFSKKDFLKNKKYPFTIFDRQEYLEKLSKLKVQDETQVDWKDVANPLKPWKFFLYSKDWTNTKNKYLTVEDTTNKTFIECVKLALKLVNNEIISLLLDNNDSSVLGYHIYNE